MVKDAELHAAEDHKRRETAEARNQLDSLIYQTEKSLSDHGGDLDAADQELDRAGLGEGEEGARGPGAGSHEGRGRGARPQASHKLAEAMYAKASQQPGGRARAGRRWSARAGPR